MMYDPNNRNGDTPALKSNNLFVAGPGSIPDRDIQPTVGKAGHGHKFPTGPRGDRKHGAEVAQHFGDERGLVGVSMTNGASAVARAARSVRHKLRGTRKLTQRALSREDRASGLEQRGAHLRRRAHRTSAKLVTQPESPVSLVSDVLCTSYVRFGTFVVLPAVVLESLAMYISLGAYDSTFGSVARVTISIAAGVVLWAIAHFSGHSVDRALAAGKRHLALAVIWGVTGLVVLGAGFAAIHAMGVARDANTRAIALRNDGATKQTEARKLLRRANQPELPGASASREPAVGAAEAKRLESRAEKLNDEAAALFKNADETAQLRFLAAVQYAVMLMTLLASLAFSNAAAARCAHRWNWWGIFFMRRAGVHRRRRNRAVGRVQDRFRKGLSATTELFAYAEANSFDVVVRTNKGTPVVLKDPLDFVLHQFGPMDNATRALLEFPTGQVAAGQHGLSNTAKTSR